MATKLTKPVTRAISLKDAVGAEGDVDVTITASGVVFSKGRRKFPPIPFDVIAKHAVPPTNMPAKHMGSPLDWLIELSQ